LCQAATRLGKREAELGQPVAESHAVADKFGHWQAFPVGRIVERKDEQGASRILVRQASGQAGSTFVAYQTL